MNLDLGLSVNTPSGDTHHRRRAQGCELDHGKKEDFQGEKWKKAWEQRGQLYKKHSGLRPGELPIGSRFKQLQSRRVKRRP